MQWPRRAHRCGSKRATSTELMLRPRDTSDGHDALVWHVTLENSDGAWQVIVDAMTGKVLSSVQLLPAR